MNYGLEPVDNGSNYPFRDKMLKAGVSRSAFPWNHDCVFSLNNAGLLLPVFCSEVLPNSDYDVKIDMLLRVLPQVVPLYSNQTYYLYLFYARYSDLYQRASTYMTKGYNGNTVLKKPTLSAANLAVDGGLEYVVEPGDLFNCLGYQIGKKLSDFGELNALPVFMYEKIYNDYFINNNLHIEDRVRLPDDPGDFRLDDNGAVISNKFANTDFPAIKYGVLRYRDYAQDYFTSSLPFQQRGNAPTLSFSANFDSLEGKLRMFKRSGDTGNAIGYVDSIEKKSGSIGLYYGTADAPSLDVLTDTNTTARLNLYNTSDLPGGAKAVSAVDGSAHYVKELLINRIASRSASGAESGYMVFNNIDFSTPYAKLTPFSPLVLSGGFTLDEFRNLAIASAELERMARTDGSFAEFGITFFGESSKNAKDFYVQFVGGTYRKIAFSEVLQTAPGGSSQTPLGSYAGHGIISDNGYLGHVHTDEHGYLMAILSVMPDVYYTQGLPKMHSRLTQAEEFLPGRDKLGLTAIFNKELYVTGTKDTDNDLFAYQTPFDEYRYKENRIIGKIADPSNLSFYPYTQARTFTSTPTYSESFFKADKVRKDYLSAPTEDAYTGKIHFTIRAVEPLSFKGTPSPVV